MTSKSVRFHPLAAAEVAATAMVYATHRPQLGIDFTGAVRAAVTSIHRRPTGHPPCPGVPADLGVRRVRLLRFPYNLVYCATTTEILILAVAHQRRAPDYWGHRIPG